MNNFKIASRLLRPKNNVAKTSARKSHGGHDPYSMKAARIYETEPHQPYTDIGYEIPWNMDKPVPLLVKFCLYFGSGFWIPFASYHYARVKGQDN